MAFKGEWKLRGRDDAKFSSYIRVHRFFGGATADLGGVFRVYASKAHAQNSPETFLEEFQAVPATYTDTQSPKAQLYLAARAAQVDKTDLVPGTGEQEGQMVPVTTKVPDPRFTALLDD